MPTKTQAPIYERMAQIERYVRRHVDGPLDRETLAQIAGYSVVHFHRLFQAHMGESISAYVRRVRLERAARRPLASDEPITAVALDCRYETHAAFGKAFKRHFCLSPSAFRDLHPVTAARLVYPHIPRIPHKRKDGDLVK